MARIRTIKPEFFQHEGLYDAERETGLPLRLAFAGLWTVADRAGRFEWRPRNIKLHVLPYDDIDFSRVLDALCDNGFVHRYELDGETYGCIPSWKKHQVPNTRERESVIPPPEDAVLAESPPSRHISNAVQRHVRARDKNMCRQCGASDDLQFDHIVPFSKGGTSEADNVQLLCGKCNLAKSDKTLDDARENHMHAREKHVRARAEGEGEREEILKKEHSDECSKESPPGEFELTVPESLDRTGFTAWWRLYPRKVGKRKALALYLGILRRREATQEQLYVGLQRAVAYWNAEGKETEFIPHPATWLAQWRWTDDYTTRKRASTFDIVRARAASGGPNGDGGTGEIDGPGEADRTRPAALQSH